MKRERDEDVDHDDREQRALDEREAKKHASGMSAEEHTLLDAYVQGRRAGRDFCSPEMNPHPAGSAKHASWERGRVSALGQIARSA
jgi:hypothetical protein